MSVNPGEDLRDYLYSDLKAEIERRDKVKNEKWPRSTTVRVEIDLDRVNEVEMERFLKDDCGFEPGELEAAHVFDCISYATLTIEVYKNRVVKVVALDDRRIEG